MPKYSIIVPMHNSAAYGGNTLKSVKNQMFTDYELICVCDSCTDFTENVARQYADKVVISSWGSDGSRQEGIDVAEGEWILFLDDDDWWIHEYVLEMIDHEIEANPGIDMLCFGFIFKWRGYAPPIRSDGKINMFWPSVWNKVYRRDFIKDVRFNNIKPDLNGNAPDIDWTRRLLDMDFKYAALDHALYYYNYLRPGSQTEELTHEGEINYKV